MATVVLLPVLVALGMWQLDRARIKLELAERMEQRALAAHQPISPALVHAPSVEYLTGTARGQYDTTHQLLLDNRVLGGRPGYHVVTPLRIAGGETRLLVNRGWIPWGDDRSKAPAFATPSAQVEVSGELYIPTAGGFRLGEDPPLANGRPTLWQRLDVERFAEQVPYPVQPVVMKLSPQADAGGFVREWAPPRDGWIDRHRGYAFQWFALAATLLVVFVVVNLRRIPSASRGSARDRRR